jgi:hypothetical protein
MPNNDYNNYSNAWVNCVKVILCEYNAVQTMNAYVVKLTKKDSTHRSTINYSLLDTVCTYQ